jgi:hypothetical protein
MSSTTTTTAGGTGAPPSPAGAFSSVLTAIVGAAAGRLEQKVAGWAEKLDGVAAGGGASGEGSGGLADLADAGLDGLAEGGGAKEHAGADAVKASLHGKNPVWAAIKGAWRAGTPVVRAAIVTAIAAAVLLLVLSPVLLLVFLLSLLIIAAVHRARTTSKQ